MILSRPKVAQTLKNARRKLRFWNFRGERFGKLERKIVGIFKSFFFF